MIIMLMVVPINLLSVKEIYTYAVDKGHGQSCADCDGACGDYDAVFVCV